MLTEKGEVKVRSSLLKYDEDSSDIEKIDRSKDDFTKEMRSYNWNYIVGKIRNSVDGHNDQYDVLFLPDELLIKDDPVAIEDNVKIDAEKDSLFV